MHRDQGSRSDFIFILSTPPSPLACSVTWEESIFLSYVRQLSPSLLLTANYNLKSTNRDELINRDTLRNRDTAIALPYRQRSMFVSSFTWLQPATERNDPSIARSSIPFVKRETSSPPPPLSFSSHCTVSPSPSISSHLAPLAATALYQSGPRPNLRSSFNLVA